MRMMKESVTRNNRKAARSREGMGLPLRLIHLFSRATVILLLGLSACGKGPGSSTPNILYIFTDDQSIRTVSCYPEAHDWVKTPNIDQLASEGIRFASCYTGTWCMPSRATALTGLLPHGIESMRMGEKYPQCDYDPELCRFWPAEFRKAGYYTGFIGKWHTGSDDGAGRDWDYAAVWNHTLPGIYGGYYSNQKISFNGTDPVAVGGYSTDNYTGWAIDFISKRAEDRETPWYLFLCYDAVHGPYTPADRHKDAYRDTPPVPVPADIFPPRPTKPSHMVNYCQWEKNEDGSPVGLDEAVRKYNRAMLALDEGVGKVLKALESTGQSENTLVVFTSDQGFAWGQHGFKWKYAPYDATLKAPLIIRWPGKITPGGVCEHAVGGHDLIPTFFAAAGIDLPWYMHGRDIGPLLTDPGRTWQSPLLMENTGRLFGSDTEISKIPVSGFPSWVFLREGKYKYIRTLKEGEIEELYDLEQDPEELTNLALVSEYGDLLQDLRKKMTDELKRTGAPFADSLPGIKTAGSEISRLDYHPISRNRRCQQN
jgi:arylsulfatase A-like enzyme